MTDHELLQMALDALEAALSNDQPYISRSEETAEALRARLAQPEQEIDPDRPHVEDDGCPTEKAVLQRFWREHQAQPKREPVAWMYDWYDETEDIDGVPIGGIAHDWISKDYDEAHSPTMGCHNIRPLYTAPPQREWVELTDKEILADDVLRYHFALNGGAGPISKKGRTIIEAIEEKLKDKNGL